MPEQPDPNEQLEQVFDTQQESEAMVVRGLLDAAGIPNFITSLDAPQDVLPGVGGVVIRVPQEKAAEARSLIENYSTTTDSEIEAAEAESEANPGGSAA